ncbi:MAG: PKD domain-containing protein [Bacteroidales bacterium]
MKKAITLSVLILLSTVWSFAQTADSGDFPQPQCHAGFEVYIQESHPPTYTFVPETFSNVAAYNWDFGNGMVAQDSMPSVQFKSSGMYVVCLGVTYTDGCTAYACDTLHVIASDITCQAYWDAYPYHPYDSLGILFSDNPVIPLGYHYSFVDFSKGNIVQWNWNFGDGTTSSDPNPRHVYEKSGMYTVCLEITTSDNCVSTLCNSLAVGITPPCSLTGTVVDYTGLDGCGLMIRLDNEEMLEPVEMVPNFVLKPGQRVRLSYTDLFDRASICMAGRIVRIDCISEIPSDTCKALFTWHSIPWISSWPPVYEFQSLAQGNISEMVWDLGDGTTTTDSIPSHRYAYSGYYNVCLTVYSPDGCTDTYCETAYFEGIDPQPGLCENYIRLTTDMILNGQTCNGSATATLVNKWGNAAWAKDYLWSTGDVTPTVHNLCPGWTYSVTVTDSVGCVVTGSFYFSGGNEYPDSLFGQWNYQQYNKDFVFSLPVFSDTIDCIWDFGDGNTAAGNFVNHTYESDLDRTVLLNVYDQSGNLIYNQEIVVSPGKSTGIEEPETAAPRAFPIPAQDELFITVGESDGIPGRIEVLSTGGQLVLSSQGEKQGDRLYKLNIAGLPAGFYIGKLSYSNGLTHSFRFVK